MWGAGRSTLRFGSVAHNHQSHSLHRERVARAEEIDGKIHHPKVAIVLMADGGKRLGLVFDRAQTPHGGMICAGNFLAEVDEVVHGDRRGALVVGGRRGEKKIALWSYTLVIAIDRIQGVAEGINARLDVLLAKVNYVGREAHDGGEGSFGEFTESHSQFIRRAGLHRDGLAQPDFADHAVGPLNADAVARKDLAHHSGDLCRRRAGKFLRGIPSGGARRPKRWNREGAYDCNAHAENLQHRMVVRFFHRFSSSSSGAVSDLFQADQTLCGFEIQAQKTSAKWGWKMCRRTSRAGRSRSS